jgi:hypothetical protein
VGDGFESCPAPQPGRIWALGGNDFAGVKVNATRHQETRFTADPVHVVVMASRYTLSLRCQP